MATHSLRNQFIDFGFTCLTQLVDNRKPLITAFNAALIKRCGIILQNCRGIGCDVRVDETHLRLAEQLWVTSEKVFLQVNSHYTTPQHREPRIMLMHILMKPLAQLSMHVRQIESPSWTVPVSGAMQPYSQIDMRLYNCDQI